MADQKQPSQVTIQSEKPVFEAQAHAGLGHDNPNPMQWTGLKPSAEMTVRMTKLVLNP